jgi:4-alpha-glucanotransferase
MKFAQAGKRIFGIAVPLGSIKTADGWRVGEYPDLVPLGRLCSGLGASLLQILPVNDTGSQSSPYSALSAYALHPLYIRVRDLPEAAKAASALDTLEKFAAKAKAGERFPYGDSFDAKLGALRAVYEASRDSIMADKQLKAFIKERPWVKTYAVFKRLKSGYGEQAWRHWPDRRDPTHEDMETLWKENAAVDEQMFHAWVQMRASEQFAAATSALAGMGIALLGDIPILMNEDSADVWADRSFFDTSMRAGAPPDMYSATGQNWGFPLYDWDAMARDGYSFWRGRIAEADRYYSAFRIDHVLGFFRIWALGALEESGSLGHFIPGPELSAKELADAGFGAERLRWLSGPHIPGGELRGAASSEAEAARCAQAALDRIGTEDLYLFKRMIRGEADISALGLEPGLSEFLKVRWRDRTLLATGSGSFAPVWTYRDSRAWASLSDGEKWRLGALFNAKSAEAESVWEKRGRELLAMLKTASPMLPCAEDLGAVPDCVPKVLADLGMPGLRVPRWMRYWDEAGQPFKPLRSYPALSVCTPSVHDTSTLRGWWEEEDGRDGFAATYCPDLSPVPQKLDARAALAVLGALAKAPSMLYVLQIQDAIDASAKHRSKDPSVDRINVPGKVDGFNWTWRMGMDVDTLVSDAPWIGSVRRACMRY